MEKSKFCAHFLNGSAEAWSSYRQAINLAQDVLYKNFATLPQPFSGIQVEELASLLETEEICPEKGKDLTDVLKYIGEAVLKHSVAVHHPACSAHLHCPPLTAALAAETMISAANQSMDSWDQSPAATMLEEKIVHWLCRLFYGDGRSGDGVFTSGGTQSNLMGLLLARDRFLKERLGWNVKEKGLPAEANKMRILCSEAAHFTVKQAAALLGLGENAVIKIRTDQNFRICLHHLDQQLHYLRSQGLMPFALAATAGTTDFGSIDPLHECSIRARQFGLWLHVDAAYGGALILSDQHKHQLDGIEAADSITVDFHKLFYQPVSCGAFLVKDATCFDLLKSHADYLNPEEDELLGVPNLVGKSIQTTRRFDALKLFVSMQVIGHSQFAGMIDHTLDIAQAAAQMITDDPRLQLINPHPSLNAVVFRYLPCKKTEGSEQLPRQNQINRAIRRSLLHSGKVVLAQTKVNGMYCLKLTMLNPRITLSDVKCILDQVKQAGSQYEA